MEIINHKTYASLTKSAEENEKDIFKSDTSYSFRIYDEKGNTIEFHTYPIKPFDKLLDYKQQEWIDKFNEEDNF